MPCSTTLSKLARRCALVLAVAILMVTLGTSCTPTSTQSPDAAHTAASPAPSPPAPKDPGPAIKHGQNAFEGARQQADAAAIKQSPAALLAGSVHQNGQGVVDKIGQKNLPSVIFAATQRVAMGMHAADLVGHYPPADTPKKPPKRTKGLKPGHVVLWYQKSGEKLELQVYGPDGRMRPEAYIAFCKALYAPGDHPRHGHEPWIAYHPRLLAMLYVTARHFDRPLEIISAFRVPRKRKASSNHHRGRAIDFRVQGIKRRRLLGYLDRSFIRAGIGWYPNSTFIHLDTRRRSYHWTDFSKPGQRSRSRKRKIAKGPKHNTDPTRNTLHMPPLSAP